MKSRQSTMRLSCILPLLFSAFIFIGDAHGQTSITNVNQTIFAPGSFSSFTAGTTGFSTTPSIFENGVLPSGVNFNDNGDGTATLSGTSDVGTEGIYPFTINATDGGTDPDASQNFTLAIEEPPTIVNAGQASFAADRVGSFTFVTVGFPTGGLSLSGALPPSGHITFVDHGDGTATLAGAPTIGDIGSYPLTLTATNGLAPDAVQAFTLVITAPLIQVIPALPYGQFNTAYSQTVSVSGGKAPYSFALTAGSLPAGMTLATNGLLSGVFQPSYPFTVTVTDADGYSTNAVCSLIVDSGAYFITTLAGKAGTTGNTDGTNGNARFGAPSGIARDSAGNLFVTDTNHTIRELSLSGTNWVVTTIVGKANTSGSADGTNSTARFKSPYGLTIDGAGNLYVADQGNQEIRRVSRSGTNWVVTSLVGRVGGNGIQDGTNSVARFESPTGIAADGAGNLFVTDPGGLVVRKAYPAGGTNWAVTTIAGTYLSLGVVDGTNGAAHFVSPESAAVDGAGNVYIGDSGTMRKMTPMGTNWVVTTIVGQLGVTGGADGTNGAVQINVPNGIMMDIDSNFVFTDVNQVRKMSPAGTNWVVKTLAGKYPLPGEAPTNIDGTASTARLSFPHGITVDDSRAVYLVDTFNNTVRKGIPASAALVTVTNLGYTYDGTGKSISVTTVPPGLPVTVTYNGAANLPTNGGTYTVVASIFSTTNFVGGVTNTLTINPAPATVTLTNLTQTYNGTARTATAVTVPPGLSVTFTYNGSATAPVAAGSYTVVGTISNPNYVGSATNTLVVNPSGVATVTLGNLTQAFDGTPKSVSVTTVPPGLNVDVTYNGSSSPPTAIGSYPVVATVNDPSAAGGVTTNTLVITFPSVTLPMAYPGTNYSQSLTATSGVAPFTFTVTGGTLPPGMTLTTNGLLSGIPTVANPFTITITDSTGVSNSFNYFVPIFSGFYATKVIAGAGATGSADGTNTSASFSAIAGIVRDGAGNLYVADSATVRRVAPSGTNWVVTTLAGQAGIGGPTDGTNSTARFFQAYGIALDVTGNLYVSDKSGDTIRKLTPVGTNWVTSTLAGLPLSASSSDGTNSTIRFSGPMGIALDGAGNIYVADSGNSTIRELAASGTNWISTTIAGQAGSPGSADGTNNAARFFHPTGMVMDALGNLYVTDAGTNTIRKLTPSGTNWVVTTIAGTPGSGGEVNGTNGAARFSNPTGITLNGLGGLYVTDAGLGTATLRQITPVGTNWVVTTLAGGSAGPGCTFFSSPGGIVSDTNGIPYIGDRTVIDKGIPVFAATILVSNVTVTYDGTGKSASVTTIPAGLPLANGLQTVTNAGTWFSSIALSCATNFYAPSTNAVLNINPVTVTITFSNLVQTYDGTARVPTVTGTPTNAPLVVAYFYPGSTNFNFNSPTNAGIYQVFSAASGNNNYSSVIFSNVFVINPATAVITLSNLNQSYDGTPKSVTATTVPPGLATVVTYNGSSIAPSNNGSYTVVASVVNSNYVGSVTNTLTIGGVVITPATVLLSNLIQTYDGTPKSVTVTTVPPGLSTAVTYNGSSLAPSNSGSYTVIATITDTNYAGGATNTLLIAIPVAFTSTNSATFNYALSNTFTVTAAGFPVPTLSANSKLPTGVAFTDNSNGSGTLSGVPLPFYGKFFPLGFVASNSLPGGVVTQSFQLTLDFAPYHPAVTGSVSFTTLKNVPLTLSESLLTEVVVTTDLVSHVTAVDPTSFQGFGRILWTNGSATYVPATDYTGPDFYQYTVTNGLGAFAGQVNLTVVDGPAQDPRAVSVTPNPAGYFLIFSGTNSADLFNVQYRNSFTTDTWHDLVLGLPTDATNGVSTIGLILYEDTTAPTNLMYRFYRVLDAGGP